MSASPAEKILLVSYLFPPAGGIPVQRILSLARFLPENGYEVQVLCCRNPGVPTMDPGLLERVPKEVRVHRVFSPELSFDARNRIWSILSSGKQVTKPGTPVKFKTAEPSGEAPSLIKQVVQGVMRRIYCPDPEVVWVPFALREARRLIRSAKIDTVLVTLPPYSSILIGLRLKQEFPHLKLVADFRDEWLDYYLNAFPFYRSDYIRKRSTAIERQTAEEADLIVAVTPTVQKQMQERYRDLPANKFVLVPNGYDSLELANFQARNHGTGKVVISYAGTMHGSSSPKQYFEALDRLPEALRSRVETRVIGRVTEDQEQFLQCRQTEIRRYGFVPQQEAFRLLEETDFLLLVQHHSPSLAGKGFEYLAMGKPILAITSGSGETAKVIEQTGAGLWAEPHDPDGIGRMLETAINSIENCRPICDHQWQIISRFDRRNLTREYARLMRGGEVPE